MNILKTTAAFGLALVASGSLALAADLPTASTLVEKMGFGINIGNTMEVPIVEGCKDMTCWGNPFPTKAYIDSIKTAGFSTVRIPCAWYTHTTDADKKVISAGWLDSVKTVVDYVVNNGMYAVLNSHYDAGWLQNNVFNGEHQISNTETATSDTSYVRERQRAYWKQIAEKFANYDEHLIFAGTNEPGVDDPWLSNGQLAFDTERSKILRDYLQDFINSVRATEGNNATRTLVVQIPRTSLDLADSLAKYMPTDTKQGYMMVEYHYYEPYAWGLMEEDQDYSPIYYFWGKDYHYTGTDAELTKRNASWGEESFVDERFDIVKNLFTSKGIPAIMGEFGSMKRLSLSGENLRLHLQSRAYFYKYAAKAAKARGIVPIIWDTGFEGDKNMTIIRRQKNVVNTIFDYDCLNGFRIAFGLDSLKNNSIDNLVNESLNNSNKSLEITYTSARSDSSETGTIRLNIGGKDWSAYSKIEISMKVNVESKGPATNMPSNPYAWTSLSLFGMSNDGWAWTDYNFKETDISTAWKVYSVPLGTSGIDFNKIDGSGKQGTIAKVQALGLNLYGTQIAGTILIDEIRLCKTDGSCDVLADFNKTEPEYEGIATVKLVSTPVDVPAELPKNKIASTNLRLSAANGLVTASFNAATAGKASVTLMNSLGQVVASKNFEATRGANTVSLQTNFHGTAFLVIRQGSQKFSKAIQVK